MIGHQMKLGQDGRTSNLEQSLTREQIFVIRRPVSRHQSLGVALGPRNRSGIG